VLACRLHHAVLVRLLINYVILYNVLNKEVNLSFSALNLTLLAGCKQQQKHISKSIMQNSGSSKNTPLSRHAQSAITTELTRSVTRVHLLVIIWLHFIAYNALMSILTHVSDFKINKLLTCSKWTHRSGTNAEKNPGSKQPRKIRQSSLQNYLHN